MTLGLGYQYQQVYDEDSIEYANLEALFRINSNINFSIKGQKDITNNKDNSILLSFNWSEPTRHFNGYHQYNSKKHSNRNQVHYRNSYKGTKYYLAANHDKSIDDETENTRLYSQVHTSKGSIRGDYSKQNDQEVKSYNLRFALAMTNKSLNLTPFVTNSFIIIDSDSESSIYTTQDETDFFNKNRALAKTSLTPYSYKTFHLNLNSLAAGEEVKHDRLSVSPTYKSGTYYKLNILRQTSIVFKILSKDSMSFKTGKLIGEKTYEFMTGKNGRVFIPDIASGKYQVTIDGVNINKQITVPNKTGYINLGAFNAN